MNEQTAVLTKRDLVEGNFGALDVNRVGAVKVTPTAGGIAFASALEVMDFAKLMAMSDKAVPKDFRGNAGMCLAITMQAIEWRMSPFQVANKAYAVNDRIGFEAQLIHAIIEARGPLKERLNCEYSGEGATRQCKVTGKFLDGSERFYESPMIKDIKVKNSPLWSADPDQQLWYYSSRAWARKWCPDVILGVYSKEEIEDGIDAREPPLPGLTARLANGSVNRHEGHRPGHIEAELEQLATVGQEVTPPQHEVVAEPESKKRRKNARAEVQPEPQKPADPPSPAAPRNAREWEGYCKAWLKSADSHQEIRKRWNTERQLRNTCGVTSEERVPIQNLMLDRCKELGE